jgi:putative ABC transport system permease protein
MSTPSTTATTTAARRFTATTRVGGFLGIRSITRGNRGVLILTTVMMALVYAELLFIPSLIQGAIEQTQQQLRDTLTANITATPSGPKTTTFGNTANQLAAIRSTPGVTASTANLLVGTQIAHGNLSSSWPVLATDPASYSQVFVTPRRMIEGQFLARGDIDQIVLGVGIAGAGRTNLATYRASLQSVHAGDQVTVTLLNGQQHAFTVKGIYDDQFAQANQRAFITDTAVSAVAPQFADQSNAIYIRTARVGDEAAVIAGLRARSVGGQLESWSGLAAAVKDQIDSFNVIKNILNLVSLLVAAITVFIVTYVDLVSKRRTIGIERAIGVTPTSIALGYAIRAVAFGLVGVIAGALLFRGAVVPLVAHHPFHFPTGPVTLSVTGKEMRRDAFILVVVATIGALIPAWRSVRLGLVEAIWG